jgi:2-iminobutanoate/2-iminopropanoate deaminase
MRIANKEGNKGELIMKKPIISKEMPQAIGPYSHGYRAGELVFTSGQLPLLQNGQFVVGGVAEQTRHCLVNVMLCLKEAGLTLDDVVKTTVYLSDMNNFTAMNAVYAEFFTKDFPARTCIEVARLPKDALVEIEALAFMGN